MKFYQVICGFSILFCFNSYAQIACLKSADTLKMHGNPKAAIKIAMNCKGNKDYLYYQFIGSCYQLICWEEPQKKYYKLALRNYKRCLRLDTNNYFANNFIGDDNLNKKKFEKAIDCYKKAMLDSLTFRECNFSPSHLYGDIAIGYLHMDSLKTSSYYFSKIFGDKEIFKDSGYFDHWLDLNIKSNYLSDTSLYRIIYPLINNIEFTSKQDSIETISILYFLEARLSAKFPSWFADENNNLSLLNIFSDYIYVDNIEGNVKYLNPGTCLFPYTIYLLSDYDLISKDEYLKHIRNTPYEKIFSFYTPRN